MISSLYSIVVLGLFIFAIIKYFNLKKSGNTLGQVQQQNVGSAALPVEQTVPMQTTSQPVAQTVPIQPTSQPVEQTNLFEQVNQQ